MASADTPVPSGTRPRDTRDTRDARETRDARHTRDTPDTPVAVVPATLEAFERRLSLVAIALALAGFAVGLVIAPEITAAFDDAKYVGIGRNLLAGNGSETVFGTVFLKHSPLWPVLITLPERLAGIHPISVGHLLNGLSALAIIAGTAALGWRIRPLVGALAAVLLAALPHLFDLARTAGIDLPSIALTLGFLLLGDTALRRRSLRLALLNGLLFGIAFDVKETILPFAPVPFLIGVGAGLPWRDVARSLGATLAGAALAMSWWFAWYLAETGHVYRADLPGWTLLVIVPVLVLVTAAGLAPDTALRIVRRLPGGAPAAALADGRGRHLAARIGPLRLAWLGTLAWSLLLLAFFARTPKLLGASIVDPEQIAFALGGSIVSVRLVAMYALGIVLLPWFRPGGGRGPGRGPAALATHGIAMAVASGVPLVLLVFGVGETPRHYVAVLALVIVLASAGWVGAFEALLAHRSRRAFVALVLVGATTLGLLLIALLPRLTPRTGIAALVAVVGGAIALAVAAVLVRRGWAFARLATIGVLVLGLLGGGMVAARGALAPAGNDAYERQASAQVNEWIAANLPPGSVIAFGTYLSMETAMDLPEGYRAVQIRHSLAIADPAAPLGLRGAAGLGTDVIAADTAPGKSAQFNVYTASKVTRLIDAGEVGTWVHLVAEGFSSKSILPSLVPENGFTEAATWQVTGDDVTITVHIYEIDRARLVLDGSRLFISPPALERLVERLERDPAAGAAAARALIERIVPASGGSLDAALGRLRTLATG